MKLRITFVAVAALSARRRRRGFRRLRREGRQGRPRFSGDRLRHDAYDRSGRTDHRARPHRSASSSCAGHSSTSSAGTRNKANAKQKIAIVQGDTQLGVDTAFAGKVAQSFASNPKVLGVVGPAGSQEVVASTSALQGAGLGFVDRLGDTRLADRRPYGRRQPARLLLPDGAERQRPGPDGGELHPPQAQGPARRHHRRPGGLLTGPRRHVQAALKAKGITVTRDSVSQDTIGLLVADREDPGQHGRHLHPVAALAAGPGVRAAAQGSRQEHHAVRLRRPLRPGDLEDHGFVRLVLPGRHERPRS